MIFKTSFLFLCLLAIFSGCSNEITTYLGDKSLENENKNVYYVRAGASGENSGLNWNDAFNELPANLKRGYIYYVAAGTYSEYTFDDAADGEKYIEIRKATESNHGGDSGWDELFGEKVTLGKLIFNTSFYKIDGNNSDLFEIKGKYLKAIIEIKSNYIDIKNCNLNGNFESTITDASQPQHSNGACSGIFIENVEYITVENCDIHDVADDGVVIYHGKNINFIKNRVHTLHAAGKGKEILSACGDGASDGFEIFDVEDSIFKQNFVYGVKNNSAFSFGGWADRPELGGRGEEDYSKNILLENNIFYNPETAFVMYVCDITDLRMYNNIFWGDNDGGGYSGISLDNDIKEMKMYNNIVHYINFSKSGGIFNADEHIIDYNLIYRKQNDISAIYTNNIIETEPGFVNDLLNKVNYDYTKDTKTKKVDNPTPEMFKLTSTAPCIDSAAKVYSTLVDFFGNKRDNVPDIGAIEYIE